MLYVQSFGQSPRGKYPSFWRYPYFLTTLWDGWKEASMPKTSSIRPVVSTQYRLVTDGQTETDGRTDGQIDE